MAEVVAVVGWGGRSFIHLLFSLSASGLFLWVHVMSFCFRKFSSYIYIFNLYFRWSYSTAPTAHRRQRGRGVREKGGRGIGRGSGVTNVVPEEKEGTIRSKTEMKKKEVAENDTSVNELSWFQ